MPEPDFPLVDPWIQTYSGLQVWPLKMTPQQVSIFDIAHSLAHQCRFGGHCSVFWSVAQHSVMASEIVPPEDALAALMHDAAEAYISDIVTPLKPLSPELVAAETRILAVIAEKFGFPYPFPPSVKEADRRLLFTEKRDLFETQLPWSIEGDPLPEPLGSAWTPAVARRKFLARFKELTKVQTLAAGGV